MVEIINNEGGGRPPAREDPTPRLRIPGASESKGGRDFFDRMYRINRMEWRERITNITVA
jgi:hypothetical protein